MSGIAAHCMFHVNKILVSFIDDIGNCKNIQGTGFWITNSIERGQDSVFVTNSHNIDPKMKLGATTKFRLSTISINLRFQQHSLWSPSTKNFKIKNHNVTLHGSADVALIKNIVFEEDTSGYEKSCFSYTDLAGQDFFNMKLNPMDVASFIGYPGNCGVPWYDDSWNLAIARSVNIASYPVLQFNNSAIPTSDAMLVSGLSFSGSSGSPVISHEKGIQLGQGLTGGNYIAPKLIGIMSGHWRETEDRYSHSGLSYLTKSTSIMQIL